MTAHLPFALLLASRLILTDGLHTISRADWSFLEVNAARPGSVLHARIESQDPRAEVRLAIIRLSDLEHFRARRPVEILAATDFEQNGTLRYPVTTSSPLAVIFENGGRATTQVWIHLELERERTATPVPPARQIALVLSGLAFFLISCIYTGKRLLPLFRR